MSNNAVSAVQRNRRLMGWYGVALTVFFVDQISKIWAIQALTYARVVPVFQGFNLSLAFNEGAAFSFLADASGWQRRFFIGFAIVMMGLLLYWLKSALKCSKPALIVITGLGLVFGGALGNLVDRFQMGRVIDFIQWYYQDWYWPTFNVADAAICVGTILLAFSFCNRSSRSLKD
jgi:signal peptidase II